MTAKFSPIAPLKVLWDLQMNHDMLGDYLLVLAHDVQHNTHKYLELIYHAMGNNGTTILDNSVIELGYPMPAKDLRQLADEITADYIVLPDKIGDVDGTISLVEKALEEFEGCGRELMKIVQGNTVEELCHCANWMHANVPGHNWAIPRWIANKFGSRMEMIAYINMLTLEERPKIHLLGMSNHLNDDIWCCEPEIVMGIDSANPLVLGMHDILMSTAGFEYQHKERGDFWNCTTSNRAMRANVKHFRRLVG